METVTISKENFDLLVRSYDTLEWLQNQGVCWRGANIAFPGWVIGNETEWHYNLHGDICDTVDEHRKSLNRAANRHKFILLNP